jgi:hypothetical protein
MGPAGVAVSELAGVSRAVVEVAAVVGEAGMVELGRRVGALEVLDGGDPGVGKIPALWQAASPAEDPTRASSRRNCLRVI